MKPERLTSSDERDESDASEIEASSRLELESDGEIHRAQAVADKQHQGSLSLEQLADELGLSEDFITVKYSRESGEWKLDGRVRDILQDSTSPLLPTLTKLVADIKHLNQLEDRVDELSVELADVSIFVVILEFSLAAGGATLALKTLVELAESQIDAVQLIVAMLMVSSSIVLGKARDVRYQVSKNTRIPIKITTKEILAREELALINSQLPELKQSVRGGFMELKFNWYLRNDYYLEAQAHIVDAYQSHKDS